MAKCPEGDLWNWLQSALGKGSWKPLPTPSSRGPRRKEERPKNPQCDCSACKRGRRAARILARGKVRELRALATELLNALTYVEDDAGYYRAIVDGSWPSSIAILRSALRKAMADADAKRQAFAEQEGKDAAVEGVEESPAQSRLPQIADLHAAGIDITHGEDSVAYVRRIRDAAGKEGKDADDATT